MTKITTEQAELDALAGRIAALEAEIDALDAARLDAAAAEGKADDYLPLAAVRRIVASE